MALMPCPACGLNGEVGTGIIVRCSACDHRWLNASADSVPSAVESGEPNAVTMYPEDARFEAFATAFVSDVLFDRRPPPARLLDAGCGGGHFLSIAGRFGYDAEGIDASPLAAALCRQRGMNARTGDLSAIELSERFDVITLWDVVEHLDQPCAVLHRLAQSLARSGVLIVKVPTYGAFSPWLSNCVPRLSGALLGAPDHVQFFTAESLKRLIAHCELRGEWKFVSHLRSERSGGSLTTRVARIVRRAAKSLSGDNNALLIAHRS